MANELWTKQDLQVLVKSAVESANFIERIVDEMSKNKLSEIPAAIGTICYRLERLAVACKESRTSLAKGIQDAIFLKAHPKMSSDTHERAVKAGDKQKTKHLPVLKAYIEELERLRRSPI